MSHEHVFLEAEGEVGGAIGRAVALADGDPGKALCELLSWVRAGGAERWLLLLRSTRYRLATDIPVLEDAIRQAVGRHGDDGDRLCSDVAEQLDDLENPGLRIRFEREVAAAAEVAVIAWVTQECESWHEDRT